MPEYGVLPSGFNRKPLAAILAELQDKAVEIFGAEVIQTPQSPMGQLHGLFADAAAELHELAQDVHNSYDPDEAEGERLDILAQLRLIARNTGESDADFARAITNRGVANIRDAEFYREVLAVEGVTWARIYFNETGDVDENGLPATSGTVAALGGDDGDVALAARRFIVPGITKAGNTPVETFVDGVCRTIRITRPSELPQTLEITVAKTNDADGCPPPSNAAIEAVAFAAMNGLGRVSNGGTVDLHRIRTALAAFPSVEVQSFRIADENDELVAGPKVFGFYEIPSFAPQQITVVTV